MANSTMNLLNTTVTKGFQSSDTSPSVATWHVAFWALMALAVNSMSQSAGHMSWTKSRYRIYLSSSPLFCVQDALCMILDLLSAMLCLRVGPQRASVVVFEDEKHSDEKPWTARSWPRTLFFVVGVLPAAIKLAALQGVPWTKTWGMMFFASFVVIELLAWLRNSAGSGDASRAHSSDEVVEQDGQPELRSEPRARRRVWRRERLFTLKFFVFCIAMLCQLCLLSWAVWMAWMSCIKRPDVSETTKTAMRWVGIPMGLMAIVYSTWCMTWLAGRSFMTIFPRTPVGYQGVLPLYAGFLIAQSFCFRYQDKTASPDDSGSNMTPGDYFDAFRTHFDPIPELVNGLMSIYFVFYNGSRLICQRWPAVARALLIHADGRESNKAGEQDRLLEPTEPNLEGMDVMAWIMFTIFLTNIWVSTVWYAGMYDPAGTVNPSWTEVFG